MMQQYTTPCEIQPTHPGLEALGDGFCMVDPEWRITYWNRSAERLTGVQRARAHGRCLWEILPDWKRGNTAARLLQVQSEKLSARFLEPAGSRYPLTLHASPLDDGGMAIQFRSARDEPSRADQYVGFLDSIRDGFLAVDPNWTIVYLNSMAESLLRFPRERAIGISLWPLLARRWPDITECLRSTMHDGLQRQLREVRPAGRAFRGSVFDLWAFPLPGGGISILFEDVSERVQRERDLARYAAEAEEANRAKSRFFTAISHELRTPLNAIVGYTHLLGAETYGPMSEAAQRAATRASVCAEHLSRLVDDVLLMTTSEISRAQIHVEKIDLDAFLPPMLQSLRHQAEAKGLEFELTVARGLPPLSTDAQRARQLRLAVVSKAVRFTSRGSVRIEVGLSSGALPESGESETFSLFPEPELILLVRDTGPGIPSGEHSRIFGPFEQLGDPSRSDSMTHGTGLGLPIARRIATLLGGSVDLVETTEQGSTFRIVLPVALSEP